MQASALSGIPDELLDWAVGVVIVVASFNAARCGGMMMSTASLREASSSWPVEPLSRSAWRSSLIPRYRCVGQAGLASCFGLPVRPRSL